MWEVLIFKRFEGKISWEPGNTWTGGRGHTMCMKPWNSEILHSKLAIGFLASLQNKTKQNKKLSIGIHLPFEKLKKWVMS